MTTSPEDFTAPPGSHPDGARRANPPFAAQRGLRVRAEAGVLARLTFDLVTRMPDGLRGVFASQMRRAAASIYVNLGEGEGRSTRPDRRHFFTVAWASLRELELHADLALASGALTPANASHLRHQCRQVGRMLHALRGALDD